MIKCRKQIVVLEITLKDDGEAIHPAEWDWPEVIDEPRDRVRVVAAGPVEKWDEEEECV
jgi:hypothetical protein